MELEVTGTFTINVTTKKCRFTNTTDYSLVGLDPSLNQMKFLGVISFQGTPLYSKTTVGDPLIDLQSGATYFEFDAELDSNGDVANGVYSISNYSTTAVLTLTDAANTDSLFVFAGNGDLAPFLSAGDTIDVSTGSNQGVFTIVEVGALSGFLVVEVAESVVTETGTDIACTFDITTQLNETQWTYSGCSLISASVNLVSDCNYGDNGTWSVSNTTVTTTQTLVSTSATINYPSWTGEAPIVVTSLPYVNNRLATGTYSVVASFVYSQVESDGLIIQYTASCTQEFDVRCAQPLCSLNKCIENLRIANEAAIQSGKTSPYQVYVDNIALLWIEAQNYLACGELSDYQTTVEAIQSQLDSSGCECDCCEDGELRWVYNTSESAQTAIELLQEQVEALENPTVYNKVIFDSVLPIKADDGFLPNNPTFYRPFTDVSEITIPKEYLQPNENGYPKRYVEIDISVSLFDSAIPYSLYVENVATSANIFSSGITGSADEGQMRIKAMIYTFENGTSGIYQIAQAEAFTIDDGVSPSVVSAQFFDQNSGLNIWDTTEDLVLNFIPQDTEAMGFVYFKITAVAIP